MKKSTKLISTLLVLCLVLAMGLSLVACNPKDNNDALAEALSVSLKNYLASDSYSTTIKSAQTTQDTLPLLYLRYVSGDNYPSDNIDVLKGHLDKIKLLYTDGAIDENGFTEENGFYTPSSWNESGKSGWQSVTDYLFSWSIYYNQYVKYLIDNSATQNEYTSYLDAIKAYAQNVDNSDTTTYVAYCFDKESALTILASNLGFEAKTVAPKSYNALLAYYEKDINGQFTKEGTDPNWLGFTGRPLASGSLLRNESAYDVNFEKSRQGLFPLVEKTDYPAVYAIDEYITLDKLCDDYDYEIVSPYGSTADNRYGILYGYINGLDMTKYTKSTDESTTYNLVDEWLKTLEKDTDGNYVIADPVDMAIAISYIAKVNGINAPTPVGLYSSALAVISL